MSKVRDEFGRKALFECGQGVRDRQYITEEKSNAEEGKLDQATCIDTPTFFSATDRQCTAAEQLTVVLKPKQRR